MANSLQEDIQRLIAEVIEVDLAEIHPNTDLRKELGADSFAALEMMSAIEDKYSIEIKREHLPEMATLERITQLVTQLRGGA